MFWYTIILIVGTFYLTLKFSYKCLYCGKVISRFYKEGVCRKCRELGKFDDSSLKKEQT